MSKHTKKRKFWTHEQEQIVRDHYADSSPQQMNKLLNGEFDIRQIAHKAKIIGIRKSAAYKQIYGLSENGQFLPHRDPPNKGKHFRAGGRSAETRFKPGQVPANWKPVGSTRITVDGYLEIKTEEGMHKWRLLHREVWKQHHGKYPPPGTALIFKDGNKLNCRDISNLELVTRKQLMQRNTVHNLPESLKEVVRLRASIIRRINDRQGKRRNSAA